MKKQQENTTDSQNQNPNMPLTMKNYYLMLIGVALLIIGFVLMSGGQSKDALDFNYDMFSVRRIIIAPLVLLAGFAFEFYAILKK